jgi:hypothetical protein
LVEYIFEIRSNFSSIISLTLVFDPFLLILLLILPIIFEAYFFNSKLLDISMLLDLFLLDEAFLFFNFLPIALVFIVYFYCFYLSFEFNDINLSIVDFLLFNLFELDFYNFLSYFKSLISFWPDFYVVLF